MCTRDSYKAGLSRHFRLYDIHTCDSHKAGLFGHFRLIRTYVSMIHITQVCLVNLD